MKRSLVLAFLFLLALALMQLPGQGAEAEKKTDGKKRPGQIKTDSVAEEDHKCK